MVWALAIWLCLGMAVCRCSGILSEHMSESLRCLLPLLLDGIAKSQTFLTWVHIESCSLVSTYPGGLSGALMCRNFFGA